MTTRRRTKARLLLVGLGTATFALPATAAADGLYGRFDGDTMLSAELGVGEAFPGESLSLRLALHYLATAGVFLEHHESFSRPSQPVWRAFEAGVELRPLFLARFATDFERGPAYLDLFADSFALSLGTYVAQLGDACAPPVACLDTGLVAETSIEAPLLPTISGPFVGLRVSLRWSEQEHVALDGMLGLTLGWHEVVAAHVVDANDRLPE